MKKLVTESLVDFLNEEETIASAKDLKVIIKNGKKCFAIMSAYQKDSTNEENGKNTKKLHKILKKISPKVISVTGEWDDNIPEKSFFALKPEKDDCKVFRNKIKKVATHFKQESYLYSLKGDIVLFYINGKVDDIGDELKVKNKYVGFKFENES